MVLNVRTIERCIAAEPEIFFRPMSALVTGTVTSMHAQLHEQAAPMPGLSGRELYHNVGCYMRKVKVNTADLKRQDSER
uniref:Uncharacterized protein n=5 Tax=Enterobacterales TaxID=91347 RepID=A0A330L061_KLEVA|nr:hypothetical protein [Serratia marcescens]QEQ70994.1 hypothetical protein [Citrobacter freundii]QEQ71115.1 hypothetical protein [Klebsiella pneumoniae]SPN80984.1 hypothetical protein PCNR130_0038 [Klebsiella variicola]QEQ71236.1 hypothetical protein [Klebsiella pneumoniae]